MADGTKIEWADATLNYVNGCSLASPGCTNCYAMKQAHRFPVRQGLTVKTKGGMVWTGEVRENPKALEQALRWKRGRAIFWNAHGDLFHPNVPRSWIRKQFATAMLTPQHRHMILTKRSDRMREELSDPAFRADVLDAASHLARDWKENARGVWHAEEWPLPNVWLGVSVEDRTRMLERGPDLAATPAAVHFWSAEPLLGELGEIDPAIMPEWMIAGGESGPNARPMHPDWARSLRDQCAKAGVPFHFKQWGEYCPLRAELIPTPRERQAWVHVDGGRVVRAKVEADLHKLEREETKADRALYGQMLHVGKKAAGRLLDGAEHNGVPA